MIYRQVGQSGLKVSALSLGSWLTYGRNVDDGTAESIIDAAYECGINSFDTANGYYRGAAEMVLGKALKKYPRSSLVVASKIFFPMGEGPNDRGLSRKHLTEQMDAILSRLQTDYLDILYCHRPDESTPLYETLRTLDDFIRRGKVLYIGVSEWSAAQITQALALEDRYLLDRLIVHQPLFNLLNRRIESEILPVCRAQGIGQMVYSPLGMGMLTGKYRKDQPAPEGSRVTISDISPWMRRDYFTDENFEKVERLRSVADHYEMNLPELALAWVLSVEGISSAIIGASRPEQVRGNVKAADIQLTPEMLEAIERAAKPDKNSEVSQ
ncbi:MAG: aldo/keto reductase family protein [Eubacteriales bacterium]|nr:aldo/keto reductase family protein [Eubacteriales bacterium]